MKKFFQVFGILAFIIFILVLIAAFAGFIFLKTFDIKKYKPQIISAVTNALGRSVDFKDIDLSVSVDKGVEFHLSDLSIAENPDFGTESFVTVQGVDAGFDLLAFATARRISVPTILIRSPKLTVIRNSSGIFNIQTLGSKPKPAVSPAASLPGPTAVAIPVILINSFKIQDAQVTFVDQTVSPELKLGVSQMTLDIKEFSLTNAFDVFLQAAVLSDEKNLSVNSKVQFDLAKSLAKFTDSDITINLTQLPLEKLKAVPQLAAIALPRILEGQLKFKVRQARVSSQGVEDFKADLFWNNGRLVADQILPGISLEARRLDVSLEDFSLDSGESLKVTIKAALYQDQTNIDFNAKILLDLAKKQARIFDAALSTDLDLWPLAKIKSQIAPLKNALLPESLSGKINVAIKQAVISSLGLEAILLDAQWQAGAVVFKDIRSGLSLDLAKTDVEVGNFSLGKQFSLSFKTAYLSDAPNISFAGAVAFDPNTQTVLINNGTAEFNANGFDLERFKSSGLLAPDSVFPQKLAGVFQAQITNLNVSPKGLGEIKADLKWQNGKIVLNDVVPGVSVDVSQINFKITDVVGLNKPFGVDATLGYESDEPNIACHGQVLIDASGSKINLKDMTLKTDLSQLSLARIKTKISALAKAQLPEKMKGFLNVTIADVSAGPSGLLSLTSSVDLKDWEVKLKELALPLGGTAVDFKVTENQISSDQFTVNVGKGQVVSKIDVDDYRKEQQWNLSAQIKGVEISEVLDQSKAAVKLSGAVFGNLKAKGQAAEIKSIAGDGNFEIKQAKLQDLNVLKTLLEKISVIPNLASDMETRLPEKYQAKLKSKDTSINKVSGIFTLADGHVVLDPISAEADEFVLNGKSQADFDQSYTFDGAFKITSELSSIMGQSSEQLTYLYDPNNNISLPVHVSGKGSQMPNISILESALDILKNAARNEGKKELGKLLDKALGVSHDSQNQPQTDTPSSSERPESPGAQIIGGILDKVFK